LPVAGCRLPVAGCRLPDVTLDVVLTRFAPAPTGWLHLGHVLNAEYVWASGADVLLRIEDHDRERCRPEYEQGILDDLDWLGYGPDVYPTTAFRAGRCEGRQSDREEVYRSAAAELAAQGLVYACDCTRREIEQRLESRGGAEPCYSGRCRDRGLALTDGHGWRVRMEPGVEPFVDGLLGPQEQDPARQSGDVLIRDRLGNWTYQFAVSVDDFRQGIDLVIRGIDLLPSTGRQIRLARLLGRGRPAMFRHHPLIMKSADQKLSKSDGDTAIRELRARGWTPERVKSAATQPLPPPSSGYDRHRMI
jgi:glutamyl/glutaminyl-tRNA synthetase